MPIGTSDKEQSASARKGHARHDNAPSCCSLLPVLRSVVCVWSALLLGEDLVVDCEGSTLDAGARIEEMHPSRL